MTFNEQIKVAFAQAVDIVIEQYPGQFYGKVNEVKRLLHADMNKGDITLALEYVGVNNARDIAQTILTVGNSILAKK